MCGKIAAAAVEDVSGIGKDDRLNLEVSGYRNGDWRTLKPEGVIWCRKIKRSQDGLDIISIWNAQRCSPGFPDAAGIPTSMLLIRMRSNWRHRRIGSPWVELHTGSFARHGTMKPSKPIRWKLRREWNLEYHKNPGERGPWHKL